MPRDFAGEEPNGPLERLAGMDRAQIISAWEEAFGSPPQASLSTAFLRKAVSYHVQCKRHGGLAPPVRRALKAARGSGTTPSLAAPTRLAPGAQLVRDWNGRTYRVEVVADGFRMDGRVYASLSAVAKRITGATWSGPRFFGLVTRAGG